MERWRGGEEFDGVRGALGCEGDRTGALSFGSSVHAQYVDGLEEADCLQVHAWQRT